ncbi:RapZ C-terminal domain-containing protein [Thermophagus sp. OGC60D27]|uniref:RapZ C-terminal domain-containing protein n=1 Tax=Thermophagus sp. OGC60D27 TaxID=3458415 RepID=UPI004037F8DC
MKENDLNQLKKIFQKWAGEVVEVVSPLPPSGSDRIYYRMTGSDRYALGVVNRNVKENRAFIGFSRHFKTLGLKVPEIYYVDESEKYYLIEDFGNTTLYDWLSNSRSGKEMPSDIVSFYKSVIDNLVKFQLEGKEGLDFSLCYPRHSFDKQSMLWDLHYFKYYFLKLANIQFDEQLLEDDYHRFADYLQQAENDYFLYRDFQSRNVMVTPDGPAFIDYQGGRRGALQYDLASLLFDAKADIPAEIREELLDYYISVLKKRIDVNETAFRNYFYGYVLIRIMQAMGAYGFRGFYEKKEHFLKSIPYAIDNLKFLLSKVDLPVSLPALTDALQQITTSKKLLEISEKANLTVMVTSFSFRRGIPVDTSGNGGGFVFDCRCIHNPGRYDEYKNKTGRHPDVIAFFEREKEMENFLSDVFSLANQSIQKYLKRNFKHLMFNFGCTGGQHRSVYAAEKLSAYLRKHFPVNVILKHQEILTWPDDSVER